MPCRHAQPVLRLVLGLLLAVSFVGCAKTQQSRHVVESGFLGDYSDLESPDEERRLKLRYIADDADWASYDKILLDPVTSWRSSDEGISDSDAQVLINNFYAMLYESLSQDYVMVDGPGEGVMRLQVAVTKIENGVAPLDLVSTVVPVGVVSSALLEFATGKPLFVGEAVVEHRMTDSISGKVLSKGVDGRIGGKALDKSLDNWADVTNAFRYWAEWARFRMCELRGDTDCVAPTA